MAPLVCPHVPPTASTSLSTPRLVSAGTGAVRTEQTEHVVADGEREIFEGFDPVGVGLRKSTDGKSQGDCLRSCRTVGATVQEIYHTVRLTRTGFATGSE